jgi:hypothetical protein
MIDSIQQEAFQLMSTEPEVAVPTQSETEETCQSKTLKVVTWFSVGIAVAAVGIFVGRELVNRYRFNHRTPYDFYANAGEQKGAEFGVGV